MEVAVPAIPKSTVKATSAGHDRSRAENRKQQHHPEHLSEGLSERAKQEPVAITVVFGEAIVASETQESDLPGLGALGAPRLDSPSFVDKGLALARIRDCSLYRDEGYENFDDDCRERWHCDRQSNP